VSLTTESKMSNENDGWGTVEVSEGGEESTQIAFELEEEEEQPIQIEKEEVVEKQPEVIEEKPKDAPPELEGIETKGAEKRIRQLIRQRKERDEEVDRLIKANEELKNNLKQKEEQVFNVERSSLEASEKQLTDKIDLARQAYLEAFDEGDKERVLKAQEMLNDAQSDLKNVTSVKSRYPEEYTEPEEQQQVQTSFPKIDRKAQEWAGDNEWFGQDKVMTAAALAIDADLKEQGYSPNDDEFYEEVNNRIKEAFPHRFGEDQERMQETEGQSNSGTSQPAQVVSGASRSSPSSGKKVKLSKEDVRLANKWGIPLEKYAVEKMKASSADGEYTNVNM